MSSVLLLPAPRVLALAVLAASLLAAPRLHAQAPPNVVVIVSDDQGWNDVGFHNPDEMLTPSLDRLAGEGLRLDRFYATPKCTPTRAGLMTGRYGLQLGLQARVLFAEDNHGLPADETTLPEMLAEAGYAERALVGKWHLGNALDAYHPLEHGFTSFYGMLSGRIDYYSKETRGERDWHRDRGPSPDTAYSTTLIADEAVRFIEGQTGAAPYFLLVAFNAPHTPMQAPDACVNRFPDLQGRRKTYAGMVACMDDGIGRILDALDRQGTADDTVVLFFSDNGAILKWGGSNAPFAGQKGDVLEGGIRTPAVIRWPAGGLAGGRAVGAMVTYLDVVPTLRRIAGLDAPPPRPLDGVDVLDVLRGTASPAARDFFSYTINPEAFNNDLDNLEELSVHADPWKLRWQGRDLLGAPMDAEIELYRFPDDSLETTNVADANPDVVDDLVARLQAFRARRTDGVRAGDYQDVPNGWKAPVDWLTRPALPGTPLLAAPADGAEVPGPDVALRWDAVADAASYEVQVSARADFRKAVYYANVGTATEATVPGLLAGEDYVWRVRALNARRDLYGFWPAARAFVVAPPSPVSVQVTPPDPPVVLPPEGGTVPFDITIANAGDTTWTGDVWLAYDLRETGRRLLVVGPKAVSLPAGASLTRTLAQAVPAGAPAGTYDVTFAAGTYDAAVEASDGFAFTKLGAGAAPTAAADWTLLEAETGDAFGTVRLQAARPEAPDALALDAAYPNPFAAATRLAFTLPEPGPVRLAVYDVLGRRVALLVDGPLPAGAHTAVFDAAALPSGTYLVRLEAGGRVATQRVLRVR